MQPSLLVGLELNLLAIMMLTRPPLDNRNASLIQRFPRFCCNVSLQELIDEWHQNASYVYVFFHPNNLIYVQIDRFPNLDYVFCESIYWNRIEMLILIFDEAQGFSVTWHNFHILANILHLGPVS